MHAYYNKAWLSLCCGIVSIFYEKATIPVKRVIGIDEYKDCFDFSKRLIFQIDH